ncbi:cupin domain-containing protein [Halocatena pleomorpha]|uniref:Cupin domain-containing protein n=1 Tax=Halocatena pleomorpha TaxID=1785090 RepID=A0A3P3R7H4_9EURY|nr:cupin domain-containing protein [Halocatena pleomorpha]RRJ28968.1 cupin domain-containing protein [Halocatena pleomorpha]
MNTVSLTALDPGPGAIDQRKLSDPLETSDVAITHYRIPPDSGLPGGVHAHMDQAELFVVLTGTARFETLDGPITVGAGEVIRFAPGAFHSGRNAGTEDLVVLAVGAPRETADVRLPFACPACDHSNLRIATNDELTLVCPDCSHTQTPKTTCPECDHGELRATLTPEARPIVTCPNCDITFDTPPRKK